MSRELAGGTLAIATVVLGAWGWSAKHRWRTDWVSWAWLASLTAWLLVIDVRPGGAKWFLLGWCWALQTSTAYRLRRAPRAS